MKKIGICPFVVREQFVWDENNYEIGHIGGSEVWAIKISDEFAKHGYDVYLFGNPLFDHVSNTGVKYYKKEYLDNNIDTLEFDYFIASRFLFDTLPMVKAKKKILMLHDTMVIGGRSFVDIKECGITTIAYQSEYQKEVFSKRYSVMDKVFFKTIEGVDSTNYDNATPQKKNKMVFSSGKGRGLYWLIENVFPKIRKAVPDFEIDITGYDDTYDEIIFHQPGINIIGNVPRKELEKLQLESKIWIYPNHGYDSYFNSNEETFCITLVENGLAKNACILSDWGCFGNTFKGYKGFVGSELLRSKIEPMDYDNFDKFAELLAEDAIKCLTDEEYRLKKAEDAYKISKQYTWDVAYKSFEYAFNTTSEYEKMNTLKVMLCCIGRQENKYIREFVDYYKRIGVTNICLYDNNRDGEDDFHDVIGDYINSGFVILKNYRNMLPPVQFIAYNECYKEYKNDYDWFLFFDIDEFMFINQDDSIKSYLSREMFKNYDVIHINWLNFGDGGQAKSDGRPLLERIQTPIDVNHKTDFPFPDNFHIKSIVRGKLDYMEFTNTPHAAVVKSNKCCNASGIETECNSPFSPYDYRYAGLRHFTTKTADEFADKVKRGFCDTNVRGGQSLVELFFKRNEVTAEKVEIFKRKCGIDVSYLLPSKYTGEKSKDTKIFTLCYEKKNFQFLDDAVITPLQVGANNGKDLCELKDNTLDNISDKNFFYVEGTGTYWIWKNVKDCKYKGQMQYRRPLSGVSDTMNFDEVFSKYDVITCVPFNHPANSKPTATNKMCIPAQTVEGGYAFSNCIDDLLVMEVIIKMYYPEYADDYDKYIKEGENLYYSNGFILRSEDYDRYAEFMYGCLEYYLEMTGIKTEADVIEHVKYNLEAGKYIRYNENEINNEIVINWQSKIGGFLSERLWTLWLLHNFKEDRIMTLPYIKMENNMYT